MKKQPVKTKSRPRPKKKAVERATDYEYVEKNIYKTGSSYRVRVSGVSESYHSLTMARRAKKFLISRPRTSIW